MKILFVIFLSLYSLPIHTSLQDNVIGIGDGMFNGNYIGGVFNHDINNYRIFNSELNSYDKTKVVSTTGEFIGAIRGAKTGDVIYVSDNARINLTNKGTIKVPAGVTIMSGRGVNKSLGALIYSNSLNTNPLFLTNGNSVIFFGLRFKGPDGVKVNKEEIAKLIQRRRAKGITEKIPPKMLYTYGLPNSQGIRVSHKNVTIENCELSNWSHAGVAITAGGEATINYSYIHHNQRYGLGYGILVEGKAIIEANVFDYNRHAISSSGIIGASYIAQYNIALENSSNQGHIFDVHGGKDRKDGTNLAGTSFRINNNLFYYKNQPVIKIRGVSKSTSKIYNNLIIRVSKGDGINLNQTKSVNDPNSSIYISQINKIGNLEVYGNDVQ